jgi:hypothetical protein
VDQKFEFELGLEEISSHGFILQEYSVDRNEMFIFSDEVGGFVQREMDELRNSCATTTSRRLKGSSPLSQTSLWRLLLEYQKMSFRVIRRTMPRTHFQQCFPLICALQIHGCSQHLCWSSNVDSRNAFVTKTLNQMTVEMILFNLLLIGVVTTISHFVHFFLHKTSHFHDCT